MRQKAESWLRQGISPQRLALTLALGFAIGCIPVLGIPTALCLVIALGLRLNMPAIQAANYAAMPFQIALIFPFVRLGRWLFSSNVHPAVSISTLGHQAPSTVYSATIRCMPQTWLYYAAPSRV